MNAQKDKWTWWKHGIFYHIYPRSFCDSNNDGIGDINGITAKLQYLSGLGITAIWISPVCKSPMKDLGYDIMDYRNIDPVFGSLDDFRRLLEEAHRQGIRIVMDLVMNHTSGLHPWFIELGRQRITLNVTGTSGRMEEKTGDLITGIPLSEHRPGNMMRRQASIICILFLRKCLI